MPAKSKKQQMAAGAALAAKRGEKSKSSLKGASKSMVKMSEKQIEEFASTKRKKLPVKKKAK
jgi:hypothetical protein